MKRRAGSFIRNDAGGLEENLKDPAMKARKGIRDKAEKEKAAKKGGAAKKNEEVKDDAGK